MVKVIFHTKELLLKKRGAKFCPLREVSIIKRNTIKRITAFFDVRNVFSLLVTPLVLSVLETPLVLSVLETPLVLSFLETPLVERLHQHYCQSSCHKSLYKGTLFTICVYMINTN